MYTHEGKRKAMCMYTHDRKNVHHKGDTHEGKDLITALYHMIHH